MKRAKLGFTAWPLYRKLFLVMALISLVPVLIVLCVALMLTYRTMEEQLVYDSKMSVEWLQERLEMEIEDYTRTFYEFEIDKDFRRRAQLQLQAGAYNRAQPDRQHKQEHKRDRALQPQPGQGPHRGALQYVFHRYGRPAGAVALPRRGAPEQSGVPEKRQGDTSHAPDAPV